MEGYVVLLFASKNVFVYCSETTENLIMCNPSYSHLKEYIVSKLMFPLLLFFSYTLLNGKYLCP